MAAPPIKTPRTCSQCGNNGHNARTCIEHPSSALNTTPPMNPSTTTTGFKLFGVRLTAIDNNNTNNNNNGCSSSLSPTPSNSPSSMMFRKSMSMNNLLQYEYNNSTTQIMPNDSSSSSNNNNNNNNGFGNEISPTGYASDDALHASASRTRERKRGTPWTEDEHKLFLVGLSKIGKGDWRGISRNFVKTRTPTQVASHAQKYFLRRNNFNRRRRRSSLFDITTDAVSRCSSDENQLLKQDTLTQPQLKTISASHQSSTYGGTPYPPTLGQISTKNKRSTPILPIPPSSKMASLNLNQSPTTSSTSIYTIKEREYEPFLSLKLSQEPSDEESPAFRGFNGSGGDSIISVA